MKNVAAFDNFLLEFIINGNRHTSYIKLILAFEGNFVQTETGFSNEF